MRDALPAWTARLLLAALLTLCLDIGFWRQPPGYDNVDVLAAVVGCVALAVALAAALLDLMQRERVRDVIGLLALAGMTAMVAGLAINPLPVDQFPMSLITHMLGGPTALVLLALALWLALMRGRVTFSLLALALIAGLAWGLYGNFQPFTSAVLQREPLPTVAVGPVVIGVLLWLAHRFRRALTPDALRLSPVGWVGVGLAVGGLLALRLAQERVDPLALAIVGPLLAFTWLIARLYRRKRDLTLLDRVLPPGRLRPSLLWAGLTFIVAGLVAYELPRSVGIDVLPVVNTLLIAFGVAWLPALSLVIGLRALVRQARAQQL